MRLIRVLADDLTGACDVGGELLGLGRPVRVRSATGADAAAAESVALWIENTQTRAIAPDEAASRVATACGPIPLARGEVAFKKIDTALRGHVAAELGAAIAALRPELVLVAPAIPEVGRTTVGGRQLLDGVPVSETAFRRDPLNPVGEASVPALLAALAGTTLREVPLEMVRDAERYAAFVRELRDRPPALLVADALTQEDLERSVAAVTHAGASLLVVGSIGVARALAVTVERVASDAVDRPARVSGAGGGVLIACGSAHPAARAQLVDVDRCWGVAPCEVGVNADESGRMAGDVMAASGLGVLTLRPGAGDAASLGAALGRAMRAAVERRRPSGLILIGGETAYHCLRALGDPVLEVEARPMPLVVRTRIMTGPWRGIGVLSKGGSAGGAGAVSAMLALAEDSGWGPHDR